MPGKAAVALSPGPVLLLRKRLLLGQSEFLLPDSPELYAARGAPVPALQAVAPGEAAGAQKEGEWGVVRVFDDGSQRLRFSREQMAGSLLRELLALDAWLRGETDDPYRLELRLRSAQFRFYSKLKSETGQMPVLDLDLLAEYGEWLTRPLDHMDYVLQSLASPVTGVLLTQGAGGASDRMAAARSHDLALLAEAGLADTSAVKQAAKASKTLGSAEKAAAEDPGVTREVESLSRTTRTGLNWIEEETRFRREGGGDAKK